MVRTKPTRNVHDSLSANRSVCGPPAQWNTKQAMLEALENGHKTVWQDWFADGRDRQALVNWIGRTRKKMTHPT